MSNLFPVRTSRLILRQWQKSDYDPYIAMNLDPDVMQYFPGLQAPEETMAQIVRMENFIAENGFGLFAVERRDSGEFIGYTGLAKAQFESFFSPCIEIGWRLDKAHWGNGFAQEAAKACLDLAFTGFAMDEIYSFTSFLNKPSINVMKNIGMKETGQFEHPILPDGHILKPHILFKLSRVDWISRSI